MDTFTGDTEFLHEVSDMASEAAMQDIEAWERMQEDAYLEATFEQRTCLEPLQEDFDDNNYDEIGYHECMIDWM